MSEESGGWGGREGGRVSVCFGVGGGFGSAGGWGSPVAEGGGGRGIRSACRADSVEDAAEVELGVVGSSRATVVGRTAGPTGVVLPGSGDFRSKWISGLSVAGDLAAVRVRFHASRVVFMLFQATAGAVVLLWTYVGSDDGELEVGVLCSVPDLALGGTGASASVSYLARSVAMMCRSGEDAAALGSNAEPGGGGGLYVGCRQRGAVSEPEGCRGSHGGGVRLSDLVWLYPSGEIGSCANGWGGPRPRYATLPSGRVGLVLRSAPAGHDLRVVSWRKSRERRLALAVNSSAPSNVVGGSGGDLSFGSGRKVDRSWASDLEVPVRRGPSPTSVQDVSVLGDLPIAAVNPSLGNNFAGVDVNRSDAWCRPLVTTLVDAIGSTTAGGLVPYRVGAVEISLPESVVHLDEYPLALYGEAMVGAGHGGGHAATGVGSGRCATYLVKNAHVERPSGARSLAAETSAALNRNNACDLPRSISGVVDVDWALSGKMCGRAVLFGPRAAATRTSARRGMRLAQGGGDASPRPD